MGKWDLSILYDGVDTDKFKNDVSALEAAIDEAVSLKDKCENLSSEELIRSYIDVSEKINTLAKKLIIYVNLRYSANTKDTEAASALGMLINTASRVAGADARLKRKISEIQELEKIIDADPALAEYRYFLLNIKEEAKHLLSDGEETVFAKMSISGATAFSDMHSALTSGLTLDFDGKEITLSQVRNLAYSPDADTRRRAYEGEQKAYDKIKDAISFALNSIKLQVISECELRKYDSPLDKALSDSRMSRATLDALLFAMEEYMPAFRKYLKAKAKALGHKGSLPFYDLVAPMGKSDTGYTVEDAKEYLDVLG